ncbi:MAG: ATP-dependent DNA helicase [Candidatus Bathyarchaeota archaeon]|nr:MAG: ATP-dependent DNA helicase [Candidatus Bathyarchaeota archaeon]
MPQLGENKLLICFRTRSQLHIYLKELRALEGHPSAVSLFSKQDMCPLRLKGELSYYDFLEECLRLKKNCKTSTKPYCKFYWNMSRKKKEAEELALDCARRIMAPGEAARRMSRRGYCAYEALRQVLDRVDVFLGTYHYSFNPAVRKSLLNGFGVDLSSVYLVVDEAHNLPSFSRELLSDRLTHHTVEGAVRETDLFGREDVPSVQEYLQVLGETVFQRAEELLAKEKLRRLNPQEVNDMFLDQSGTTGLDAAQTLHEYGEFVRKTRQEQGSDRIFSYNHRVGELLKNFFEKVGLQYVHLVQKEWRGGVILEVRSMDGRELTDPVLQQVRGSILMSGFLSPPKVYRDLMLNQNGKIHLKEFDSPFPPENRLILAARGVSSRFEKRTDRMLDRWKGYIEAISKANEGNVAVFFTSYGLMQTILPLVKDNRDEIVEQRKTRRNEVMNQLAKSPDNILYGVMGGKFSEGIDYPGNLLTCVATVGLPYATWDIYQKALIDYFDHQFPREGRTYAYLTPAILRLIQTCGRVHRSASDKGCILILDERVTRPAIKQQLPKYFQREMAVVTDASECAGQISDFWERQHKIP